MAVYTIKDLEKLSGIKAHTIRIWEQRYDILLPQRTKTNIRYYQQKDLNLLLNIALLNRNGVKISKISKMSSDEITEKVATISLNNPEHKTQIDALTISMIEMNEYKFDKLIELNTRQIGFERTILEVIFPFLDKLSLLWLTGSINPVQENFMSCLIRRKIIAAIDKLPFQCNQNAPKFIIYLPEGEQQELSLLLMDYLLRNKGNQVIYLGQNIGIEDLKDVCKIHQPDYIYTMITEAYSKQPVAHYIERLRTISPNVHLLLSGYQVVAQGVSNHSKRTILRSLEETIVFLDNLKDFQQHVTFRLNKKHS